MTLLPGSPSQEGLLELASRASQTSGSLRLSVTRELTFSTRFADHQITGAPLSLSSSLGVADISLQVGLLHEFWGSELRSLAVWSSLYPVSSLPSPAVVFKKPNLPFC